MDNFKSIIQLFDHFKTEEQCREHFEQLRWNGNPVCPHCGADAPYRTTRRRVTVHGEIVTTKAYKCSSNKCHKKFTATVGTIFENTKIPLRVWFGAIYLSCNHKKGISSLQLAADLSITQKTAWFVLHRLREMVRVKDPVRLDGMVEIDETFVGGKEGNKHKNKKLNAGRGAVGKTTVLGLLSDGKVQTHVVKDAKAETLLPIIKSNVTSGSVMVSDEWSAYKQLGKEYFHETVRHNDGEYVNELGFHTNSIEGYWSHFKRTIYGTYHQVSPKHLTRYCDESQYRWNTRSNSQSFRFDDVIANSEGRLKYKDLIAPVFDFRAQSIAPRKAPAQKRAAYRK